MVVHLKHFLDGYPLCWDQDQMGAFEGTKEMAEVDCEACKKEMAIV